jgi:PDZ domain-containing protein
MRATLKRIPAAFAAAILLSTYAAAKDADLLSLSADHFRDTASVAESPAHDVTVITTEPGYAERSLGALWHDEYLKAVIDHGSGGRIFEIDVMVTYGGPLRSYRQASIESPAGPKTAAVTPVRTQSANCQVSDCVYTEYLAVPIDAETLRQMAATYAPGKARLFDFKLVPKIGRGYRGTLSNAEVAGFLARVDGYRYQAAAAPVAAPPPPQRLEFGISGLAVAPSAAAPNRAGVLVVAVNADSVAQKAGVITGDIVYRLDARPIQTPSDLDAAVGAIAAGTGAVIHVFRGTNEVALPARF